MIKPGIIVVDQVLYFQGRNAISDIEKASKDPLKANEKLLLRILKDNESTEYGRKFGFGEIQSIDEYRRRVPFSDYSDYEPYIERMIHNKEKDLITAYDVIQYAETSGSVGKHKTIPVTDKSMEVYQKYSFARTKTIANRYYWKEKHELVPSQKGLNMLETETTKMEDGTPVGSVTGSVSKRFRGLFPVFLTSPDPVLFPEGGMNMNYMKIRFALEEPDLVFILSAFMTNIVDMMNYLKNNWEMVVDDIENGTLNQDVCDPDKRDIILPYIKAHPERAQALRAIFEEGFDTPIMPRIWPGLRWVSAIGTAGFAMYTEKFKQYAGDDIAIDYFVYAASEGMFAAAVEMNDPRFVPLMDSCFFEFLPADAAEDDTRTLTIDQLEDGKEYEIIITNQCGFYRYRIKDVIRVVGFYENCPMITFAYRKNQLFNVAAEKTTEEHIDEAVRRLGKALNCEFPEYAVYLDTKSDVSRYVLLLEPETPIPVDSEGKYGEILQKILCDVNPEYPFFVERGTIGTPLVLIQQPQTHRLWREMKLWKGASPNQVKPVKMLDIPQKQQFFFELLEENQEKPDI